MGIFGGSSQSSAQVTNSINFNPSIQVGDANTATPTSKTEQTALQSPTLKDDLAASVGLGFGGSGSGGPVSKGSDEAQPKLIKPLKEQKVNIPTWAIAGIAGLGMMMVSKDKRKR